MSFSNSMIWECMTTSIAGGGGYNPASANFPTDLTTDAATGNTASPVVSSATYSFIARDVGACLFVQGGTNWIPGWYRVASVAANKATLSAAIGAGVLYSTVATQMNYHRPNGVSTLAGVATVATPTAGVWGIDYSQQTTAGITYTDMVIDATTNTIYTSAAFPVGPHVVGNVISVTSGTGFTVQRVEVVSVTGTQATCDKSLGTLSSTGGNGVLGGAIAALTTAVDVGLTGGNKMFIKATANYGIISTILAATKGDTTNGKISIEGYTTTRGLRDGRATITSATNSEALITLNDNDYFEFIHLNLTHTAATRGAAITVSTSASTPLWFIDCVVDGCYSMLFSSSALLSAVTVISTEIKNCTSSESAVIGGSSSTFTLNLYGCDIHDNVAADGVRMAGSTTQTLTAYRCMFDTNVVGINVTGSAANSVVTVRECTFVDNTGSALKIAATSGGCTLDMQNNIFYGSTGYGIENLDEQAFVDNLMKSNRNNAFGANSTAAYLAIKGGLNEVTLTADPFTNRATRDFRPNDTAGGGALLRAARFSVFGQTDDGDIGAIQHTDAGGGEFPTASEIADEVQTRTIAAVTTVATVTNLTNAPTAGDFTATMKAATLARVTLVDTTTLANTATTLTNLPAITANWFTAAGMATDARAVIESEVTDALTAYSVGKPLIFSGTADSGSTTTMVDAARTEADPNYWKGAEIQFTSGNISGQNRIITEFDEVANMFTFAPALTQAVTTQTYCIIPHVSALDDLVAEHMNSGSAGEMLSQAGAAGDPASIEVPGSYPIGTLGYAIGTYLNVAMDSRMATYTQPTGFLTATFPTGTIANTTNITAGTLTSVTNQLTAAALATGIFQDTTAGDFTVAGSIGKSLFTAGVVPGGSGGLFISGTNASLTVTAGITANITGNLVGTVSTVTTYTGNTPQTGDAFAVVNSGTHGNAVIKGYVDDIGPAGAGLTDVGGFSTTAKAQIETEANDALVAIHLDHLLAVDYDPTAKPGAATALFNEIIGNDGGVSQLTANTLELAPGGGGGGTSDWTADQRTAIAAILGIPASGTTPEDPTVGVLAAIKDLGEADRYIDITTTPWQLVLIKAGSGNLATGTRLLVQDLFNKDGVAISNIATVVGRSVAP